MMTYDPLIIILTFQKFEVVLRPMKCLISFFLDSIIFLYLLIF